MKSLLAIAFAGLAASAAAAGPPVLSPDQLDLITAGGCSTFATAGGMSVTRCIDFEIGVDVFDLLDQDFNWPVWPGMPGPGGPVGMPTEPPGCETGACN